MASISDLLLNAVGFSQNTRWRSEDLEFRGVRNVQVGLRSECGKSGHYRAREEECIATGAKREHVVVERMSSAAMAVRACR